MLNASLYPYGQVKRFLRIPVILHRAVLRAVDHDCFNLSQSAAYSAMVALFPALIVAATVILAILFLYRPATTIPGVVIVLIGVPVYFAFRASASKVP